jgi:asparagine synthase (glutamine-hydrolysing)
MASAIEARVPFLDVNVVERAYQMPFDYKNRFKSLEDFKDSLSMTADEISENKDIPKVMLKEIGEHYLPQEIVWRKKQGFPLPLNDWVGGKHIQEMKDALLAKGTIISHYIDTEHLKTWMDTQSADKMFGQRLWMIYSLNIWLEHITKKYKVTL